MNLFGYDILPAASQDFHQLCRLFDQIDALHRQARPDLFHAPPEPSRDRAEIERLIAGPDSIIFKAEDAAFRHIVGLAVIVVRETPAMHVKIARRFAELDTLVVDKHARRQGVGRALVRASFAWAAERGFGAVELGVHEFNAPARAFYAQAGFATTLRRLRAEVAP
jgi:GNAT superfamily N-acetyltransferase